VCVYIYIYIYIYIYNTYISISISVCVCVRCKHVLRMGMGAMLDLDGYIYYYVNLCESGRLLLTFSVCNSNYHNTKYQLMLQH
jgi:hypothetical protein